MLEYFFYFDEKIEKWIFEWKIEKFEYLFLNI